MMPTVDDYSFYSLLCYNMESVSNAVDVMHYSGLYLRAQSLGYVIVYSSYGYSVLAFEWLR